MSRRGEKKFSKAFSMNAQLSDLSDTKGAWGFLPNKQMYFCPFAAQNTMLAIFPRTDVRFQAEQLHSAQAFAVFDSDSSPIFRRRLFAFSNKAILFFFGAVTAYSGRQFYEIHNCFFLAV